MTERAARATVPAAAAPITAREDRGGSPAGGGLPAAKGLPRVRAPQSAGDRDARRVPAGARPLVAPPGGRTSHVPPPARQAGPAACSTAGTPPEGPGGSGDQDKWAGWRIARGQPAQPWAGAGSSGAAERPDRLLQRARRGEDGRRLIPAVCHAVGAARVLPAAVGVPVGGLDELFVGLRVPVGHQVARLLPAEQRVRRDTPRRAAEV